MTSRRNFVCLDLRFASRRQKKGINYYLSFKMLRFVLLKNRIFVKIENICTNQVL